MNGEHYFTIAPDAHCTPEARRDRQFLRSQKCSILEEEWMSCHWAGEEWDKPPRELYLIIFVFEFNHDARAHRELKETFHFKRGKMRPVPHWGQSSVQGEQHHFPQIPLRTLQLETHLHAYPSHRDFLVYLPQSLNLRAKRNLWCYLKYSVLSNFQAAAVPQVSCTKPCCTRTCEYSQKINNCINGCSLTFNSCPCGFPGTYLLILEGPWQKMY